jgi:hypothetical protein
MYGAGYFAKTYFGANYFGPSGALASISLVVSAPTLAQPTLGQKHILGAIALAVQSPTLGSASVNVPYPISIATSSPTFTPPTLAQKQVLAAQALIGGGPVFGALSFGFALSTPIGLVVSAPTIAVATLGFTFVLHAANLIISGPGFGAAPEAEEFGPPMVWLRNRLKHWSRDPNSEYFDEDDTEGEGPVKEAIFSNLNDEIELTISQLTLVGRTSPERGPAEAIACVDPLYLHDLKLQIDWSDVEQVKTDVAAETSARTAAIALLRQVVTTPTTFYVSPSGNNANDGSSGAPWQTVQHAAQRVSDLDVRANVTVQIADGTYSEIVTFYPIIGGHGASVSFVGNDVTPANCVLRSAAIFQGSVLPYVFSGIRFAPTASGTVLNVNGAQVHVGSCEFAATVGAFAHIRGGAGAVLFFDVPYRITGGAARHLSAEQGAKFYLFPGTMTIVGTPAFSAAFAWAEDGGSAIYSSSTTFSGGATGKRYHAELNGILQTYGSGINYYPGNVAGDVATGGQYL